MYISQVRDYLLGEKIGEGTFGKVRMAKHIPTNEIVALKIIDKQKHTITEKTKIHLLREMKILQRLNHPNLIELYEIFENEQNWYIVMEYIDGGELFDFVVNQKRTKESLARKFFAQIVSGMSYCHSNNIVHRDLKLENLLLTNDLKIKIIDFGLSNFSKRDELLNTFCGSASYAAPEVIQGKKYDGLKSDVWSLGVLLYVLLVGKFPFGNKNIKILMSKILKGSFNFPKFVSESAQDLIKKMLIIDPESRYSINQVKKHEWFKLDESVQELLDIKSVYSGELINPLIVIKMTPMGFPYQAVLNDLQSKQYSQHMATYLIIRKQAMEGRFEKYQNLDLFSPITVDSNLIEQEDDQESIPNENNKNKKNKKKNKNKNKYPLPKENSFRNQFQKTFTHTKKRKFSLFGKKKKNDPENFTIEDFKFKEILQKDFSLQDFTSKNERKGKKKKKEKNIT